MCAKEISSFIKKLLRIEKKALVETTLCNDIIACFYLFVILKCQINFDFSANFCCAFLSCFTFYFCIRPPLKALQKRLNTGFWILDQFFLIELFYWVLNIFTSVKSKRRPAITSSASYSTSSCPFAFSYCFTRTSLVFSIE